MSLDDESPTQYFGPDAVTLTIQGKQVRMRKDEYLRLTERPGALTDEEMLNAVIDGKSLADILAEANKRHVEGCSIERNGKCICAYINQWPVADTLYDDGEECAKLFKEPGTLGETIRHPMLEQGHTFVLGALSGKPLTTEEDIMAEIDQLRTEMTTEDAAEISRRGTRERCTDHPYSWHFTDAMTCDQLNEELLGVGGFSELTMHPSSMVRLAAQTSNRLVKEAKQSTDIQRQRAEFHKARAKGWERNALWASILGTAGWAFSIARGVWGF